MRNIQPRHFKRRRRMLSLGVAAFVTLLGTTGCQYRGGSTDCDDGLRDWEQETFDIVLPVPPPVDLGRLPVTLIEPHYTGPYRMVAQLTRGDFAGVQAHWQNIEAVADPVDQMQAAVRTLDALEGRGLAVLHQTQAWLAREPDSLAAQLMLAAAFAHAGREVRNQIWDPKTTFARFRRLEGRLQAAANALAPLLERNDVYGRAARELNLGVRFEMNPTEFDQAWDLYISLMDFAPEYEWLYLRAADHAAPEHSKTHAPRRYKQLQELAESRGLSERHRIALAQKIDALEQPPDKIANPQAWRPYWEARIKDSPTVNNLVGWMRAEYAVSNWPGILDASSRVLDQHPHHRYAWEHRSWALNQMGRLPESYDAAMVAITLGSDWAMNRVVQGFARGEMGLPHGDYQALLVHCQYGAMMALGAAANCLGSSHTDGFAGALRDDKAALSWHLLGARAGHFNSQHDVAVLLPKVVKDPALARSLEFASGHWLRRAGSQNHVAARNKLEARPDWGKVCTPLDVRHVLRSVYAIVRALFL